MPIGIETCVSVFVTIGSCGHNEGRMPIGIETPRDQPTRISLYCHNEGRMPIGIETSTGAQVSRTQSVTMRGECR